jgi:DNA-binding response OmpR family regulator
MSGPRILIVEDEFLIRLTLAEALTEDGFDVVEAETADEALGLLRQEPALALLLTDIQLPGSIDGLELARLARAELPRLPVIYMTGRPDRMGRIAGEGHDVFIPKPYLPSDVCAVARRLTGV